MTLTTSSQQQNRIKTQASSISDSTSKFYSSYTANYPIYSLVYHAQTSTLILGGGGGPSRSGVPNGLLLLKVIGGDSGKSSKIFFEEFGELLTGDEAVMSLSLYDDKTDCLVVAGVNDRCWLLEYEKSISSELEPDAKATAAPNITGKRVSNIIKTLTNANTNAKFSSSKPLNLLRTIQSDASPNDDGYLRVTRFISNGHSFIAAGSDGSVREWTVPEMRLLHKVETDGSEILDADGQDQVLALVNSTGDIQLNISKTDPSIILKPSKSHVYKFVRFCYHSTAGNSKLFLWAIENYKPTPGKSSSNINNNKYPRLVNFDLGSLIKDKEKDSKGFLSPNLSPNSLKPLTTKSLPVPKNCTAVLLQNSSKFLAFGFADGSLLVLSSDNSKEIYLLKRAAHPFPVTGLAIDEKKRILISSSADGLILVTKIPLTPTINFFIFPSLSRSLFIITIILIISVLILCFAIFAAQINLKFNELDDFDSFYKMFPTDQADL